MGDRATPAILMTKSEFEKLYLKKVDGNLDRMIRYSIAANPNDNLTASGVAMKPGRGRSKHVTQFDDAGKALPSEYVIPVEDLPEGDIRNNNWVIVTQYIRAITPYIRGEMLEKGPTKVEEEPCDDTVECIATDPHGNSIMVPAEFEADDDCQLPSDGDSWTLHRVVFEEDQNAGKMKYDSPRREQLSFVQRSDGNGDGILAIPYHSELRGKGKAKGEHIGYYTLQYGFFCIPCDPLNCWIVAHDNRPRSNWFHENPIKLTPLTFERLCALPEENEDPDEPNKVFRTANGLLLALMGLNPKPSSDTDWIENLINLARTEGERPDAEWNWVHPNDIPK